VCGIRFRCLAPRFPPAPLMPDRIFLLRAILSTLEDGSCLGRLLLFPEVSAYGRTPGQVVPELVRQARVVLGRLTLSELHRWRQIGELTVREVSVEIAPPQTGAWTAPLPVRFDVVCWNHGSEASVGYVPALGIEVVVPRPEELDARLPDEIRFALLRSRAAVSLRSLVALQRMESLRVQLVEDLVEIKTPKQLVRQREQASEESVLHEVASQLNRSWLPRVFGLDSVVRSLGEWLFAKTPRSVLLVGPSGVGKTAAVHKLASQSGRGGAAGQPIWSTSGARLVAGMSGFGMWQERCQQLCREATRTKAVIHFGNLMELMQVGQSVNSDVGMGEFLRPAIARGDVVVIAECTAEELARIERISPAMLDAFVRLDVPEPSREECLAILRQAADAHAPRAGGAIDTDAIAAVDRLHRRYATYSACPGRPLRFLKNLLADAPGPDANPGSSRLTAADVTAAFSRETSLPELLLE
jgi:ATP-dependent Clp protease ATP-binding subunit ClpC